MDEAANTEVALITSWLHICIFSIRGSADVSSRMCSKEFHTFTVPLVARATICHQPDYTQRPDTTPLCEHDWQT